MDGSGFFSFHTVFYSVFFPFFFRHFLKNPEKCRKKMVLFFSGNLRFVSVFGSKTELKPDKIRKIPMRIKTGTATCGFFKKNCVFLEKKKWKNGKKPYCVFKKSQKIPPQKKRIAFFKNAKKTKQIAFFKNAKKTDCVFWKRFFKT